MVVIAHTDAWTRFVVADQRMSIHPRPNFGVSRLELRFERDLSSRVIALTDAQTRFVVIDRPMSTYPRPNFGVSSI